MHQLTIILGNLGKEPNMRYTPSGDPVTDFSVAVNRTYNGKKETTWFKVTAWGKLAEVCKEYLKQGSKVYIEGRLKGGPNGQPRIWTKQDGSPAADFELVANTVRFLDPKGDVTHEAVQTEKEPAGNSNGSGDEEFPF